MWLQCSFSLLQVLLQRIAVTLQNVMKSGNVNFIVCLSTCGEKSKEKCSKVYITTFTHFARSYISSQLSIALEIGVS